jgi:hypothetical protein
MDCDWTIEAPVGKNIHLNFLSFNVEYESDCKYDWVEVHSGLDTFSPSYGRLCGNLVRYIDITIFNHLNIFCTFLCMIEIP